MILADYKLRELCIENEWYTSGSIKQYQKLFERNAAGGSLDELSIIIWICSNNCSKDEIFNKLLKAAMAP